MPPAIDTLKVSHRLQSAGMPRKQADVVVEALADAVADHPSKDAVIEAVETLGRSVDKRITALETKVDTGFSELRELLHKIIDGQAVLHQNDMELKRRLDERKS